MEVRDDARRIVWGIDKNSQNTSGIEDAQNNTHVDPKAGATEPVTTYMYAIATMSNADTLTKLLAYAYNGSLEARSPMVKAFYIPGPKVMVDFPCGL